MSDTVVVTIIFAVLVFAITGITYVVKQQHRADAKAAADAAKAPGFTQAEAIAMRAAHADLKDQVESIAARVAFGGPAQRVP